MDRAPLERGVDGAKGETDGTRWNRAAERSHEAVIGITVSRGLV
jgi:hypothetical protein